MSDYLGFQDDYLGFQDDYHEKSLDQYYREMEKHERNYWESVNVIYDIINKNLSKLRPNYGYNEKYDVAYNILKLNGHIVPENSEVFKLLDEVLGNE